MVRNAVASVIILAGSALCASAATLYVEASAVQIGGGNVFAGLCIGGLEENSCRFGMTSPASANAVRFTFSDVPPGTYAVAVFQDMNGNGRLDRTPLGLPLEPYGFSNDAGRLRRPSFPAASVQVTHRDLRIGIRLAPIPQGRQP